MTQLGGRAGHFYPLIPDFISQGKPSVITLCLCISTVSSENSFICLSVNETQSEENAAFYFINLDI